tara:strand:- start:42 stop:563 length:522 start_codon:yes stop_codon:yes gene_type:complete
MFYHYHTDEEIIDQFKKLVDICVSSDNSYMIQDERWKYSTKRALQFSIEPSNNILNPITSFYKEKVESLTGKKINIGSMWTVYGEENAYHACHSHLLDDKDINNLATVLYLEIPQQDLDPGSGALYYFMDGKVEHFYPKKGDFIIFPVGTYHGTYPQERGLRQTLNMDWIVHN